MSADSMDYRGKPYYSLDAWCKNTYGEKLYKIALDAGLTCPNRDGTLDSRGCIFCSAGGSGEFAAGNRPGSGKPAAPLSIREQLEAGKKLLEGKRTGSRYIAYFQAYTNTYGPPEYLASIFRQALAEPDIAGISIATRPDCLGAGVMQLLLSLKQDFPGKFIWVELGLQTIHEETARFIRRGYSLSCFTRAMESLHKAGIPVIVHVILGLPGETEEMVLDTIRFLNRCGIFGIKLQLLHILEHTDLAALYREGKVSVLSLDAYLSLLLKCIAALSPDIVIHRLTGDGPKRILIAPSWSGNKRNVLNTLHQRMKLSSVRQGQCYESGTFDSLQIDCAVYVGQGHLPPDHSPDQ